MTAVATRSAVIALREERRAMREGCAFLDEKCLLLVAAMLAELRRRDALERELVPAQERARLALAGALARHGLNGLQCQPAADALDESLVVTRRSLLGVALLDARVDGRPGAAPPAANPSPESAECRAAWAALVPALATLAAIDGNLARLLAEYRRTMRRVRALENVVLPEIEHDCEEIETILSELERDEAVWARFGRRHAVS